VSDLFVHRYGVAGGSPLLAVHGVSAHGRRFVPMVPVAFPGADVFAPDLRGHGRSPADAPSTIERHVQDLLAVMDGAGVSTFDIVGHSYGACIATHLLASHPERIRSVVLLDPAMALPAAKAEALSDLMIAGDVNHATIEALVQARRAGRSEAAIPHSDADTRLAAVETADGWKTPWDRDVVIQAWKEMTRPMPSLPEPRPTLLVDATQAGFVTEVQRGHLRSELGEGLTDISVDLGHMLYWDDFEATCAIVRTFLAEHAPETIKPS
jgi:lipase